MICTHCTESGYAVLNDFELLVLNVYSAKFWSTRNILILYTHEIIVAFNL